MAYQRPILVYEQDRSVLASLEFALALEGYRVLDGTSAGANPRGAACLIIEQRHGASGGLALLAQLRAGGCNTPTVLMATNPTRSTRKLADAAGVPLIEKPLLNNDLTQALRSVLRQKEAV
ncbi:response regulator [Pacificimonas flava]|uniref:Response regulator receiver protein n=1 Tax=Pacificimonas flava TaxID=1234595 RepID=M2S896_9SPHN|nr:response regulator [Pacificimonas flava]EMD81620.1 response regulator receiver protein [Pacificimonas flava]MBB5281824.1 FixJ family two-component response regulator [Pacificimonas flava]